MKINPTFTRGEYWLLTSVVESAIPICWLDWHNIEEALNRSTHGMSRILLKDTILKLSETELIEAFISGDKKNKIVLTPETLDSALDERQHSESLYYRLTQKGGVHWEAFAQPNWSYYVNETFTQREDSEYEAGEIICLSEEVLQRYFNLLSHSTLRVEDRSVTWKLVKPWNATYWKELPLGHSVCFEYVNIQSPKSSKDESTINKEDYDNLWCEWR